MTSTVSTELQPHEVVWAVTNASVASRALQGVARLGGADSIDDRPVAARELAARCGAHGPALERVLHLLAAQKIFEAVDGGFRHTPASELLRSDHPMSMRAFSAMMGLPLLVESFAHLDHAVRTGEPAARTVHPEGIWGYMRDHPEEARTFGAAMAARAAADLAVLPHASDFGRFATVAAILDGAPHARGVLFDLPAVIATLDVEDDRLTLQAGDFFTDRLPAADAYVLMDILHDWGDVECLEILAAIRRAAAPGATVLVIEDVLADTPDPRGRGLDVIMLAVTGGRERTAGELGALFNQTGFGQGRVIETGGPRRIVETTAS